MPLKLNLNWCRGGSRRNNAGDAEAAMQKHFQAGATPPATGDTAIKRLQELENYYQVDWSQQGFLGRGHFAEVYRGVDIRNGTKVAVKRISRQNQDVRTLRQEIAALLKVNGHPNIVKLYDVFIDQNLVILCMELLEGGELFSRVVTSGAYSERDASRHFCRITQALEFMHKHGIVHRDLKPENLVLTTEDPDSDIKISDFGLSKVLGEDQSVMYTVCGTSAYAAPEVGLSSNYDSKVDTWSLGVILFVVLAAYHPFDPYGRLDDMGLRTAVCNFQWDFKDKVWDKMSTDVKDLISKLIAPVDERLDATQVLQHPWITKYQDLPSRPLNELSTRSLRQFVSSTAFGMQGTVDENQPFVEFDDDVMMDDNDIEPLPFDNNHTTHEHATQDHMYNQQVQHT
mmetsp:Transcript_20000/g.32987  ORF Transcript_20000/g.32987 Transcript_20000/m.32987 type:complete len:399 (-) Transcript_20000:55-1251(-)